MALEYGQPLRAEWLIPGTMAPERFKQLNDALRDAPNPTAWIAAADAMEVAEGKPLFGLPCARCLCRDTDRRVERMLGTDDHITVVCSDPCPDRVGEFTGIMEMTDKRFERWAELQDARLR